MRVLHVFNELKYSGAEIMYSDTFDLFSTWGCDLIPMSTSENIGEYSKVYEELGARVLHTPKPSKYSVLKKIFYVRTIERILCAEKIDVVHIHSSSAKLLFIIAAWRIGVKSLYSFHNVFPTRWYSYFYHILERAICKNLFKCQFHSISKSVYNHELGFYLNKTKLVDNWYNENRFYPSVSSCEKDDFRKELGIPINSFVVISIGGCSPIKQHTHVICAVRKLIDDGVNVFYLHVGEGEDETCEKSLVDELDLKGSVLFVGNKKDVRKYLIASDIYVMPSLFEGISLTTIEAMACKIPTVLYDVPGLRDFKLEENISCVIKPGTLQLSNQLIYLHNNKTQISENTDRAYEFVTKKYNMISNAKKILDIYLLKV